MSRKRLLYTLLALTVLCGVVLAVSSSVVESSVAAATNIFAGVWHTPPYQGYTPMRAVPRPDAPGTWHTPPYQGYTSVRSVPPPDAPGTWHTPPYQGYSSTYGDVQSDCSSFCP